MFLGAGVAEGLPLWSSGVLYLPSLHNLPYSLAFIPAQRMAKNTQHKDTKRTLSPQRQK